MRFGPDNVRFVNGADRSPYDGIWHLPPAAPLSVPPPVAPPAPGGVAPGGNPDAGYQNTYGTIPSTTNTADVPFAVMGFNNDNGVKTGKLVPPSTGPTYGGPPDPAYLTDPNPPEPRTVQMPDLSWLNNYTPSQQDISDLSWLPPIVNGEVRWPENVQAPNISWGGLSQADITRLMQTPTLPSDNGGGGGSDFGSRLLDKINSIGTSPHITGGNVGQAAINAAGMVTPLAPIAAGLLQGFNLYDAPDTTGNPLADVAGTPGAVQSGIAKAANWVDRLFGGTYMPSAYVYPTIMGPTPDGSPYSTPPMPAQLPVADNYGGSGGGGGYQSSYPDPTSFDLTGNMLDSFMQGAGWGGAGFGYGGMGMGAPYGYGLPDNNGGWGQ